MQLFDYWIKEFNLEYRNIYNDYCLEKTYKHISDFWNRQWISKYMPMPWYINYPINGDILYNGDRRRWQSMIINKIYFSKNSILIDDIVNYITEQKFLKIFDTNYKNPYYYTLSFEDRQKGLMKKTNRYQVIRDYYKFLINNNIINANGKFNINNKPCST